MYDDHGRQILTTEQFRQYIAEKLPDGAAEMITAANGPFPIPSELAGPLVHDEYERRIFELQSYVHILTSAVEEIKTALKCRFNLDIGDL